MKTKEERNVLRNEVQALNAKFADLTEAELTKVAGGVELGFIDVIKKPDLDMHDIA